MQTYSLDATQNKYKVSMNYIPSSKGGKCLCKLTTSAIGGGRRNNTKDELEQVRLCRQPNNANTENQGTGGLIRNEPPGIDNKYNLSENSCTTKRIANDITNSNITLWTPESSSVHLCDKSADDSQLYVRAGLGEYDNSNDHVKFDMQYLSCSAPGYCLTNTVSNNYLNLVELNSYKPNLQGHGLSYINNTAPYNSYKIQSGCMQNVVGDCHTGNYKCINDTNIHIGAQFEGLKSAIPIKSKDVESKKVSETGGLMYWGHSKGHPIDSMPVLTPATSTENWNISGKLPISEAITLSSKIDIPVAPPLYSGASLEYWEPIRELRKTQTPKISFLKQLGVGGFSKVYLSRDESLKRLIVCKRIKIYNINNWKYHPVLRKNIPYELHILGCLKKYNKYFVELYGFIKTDNEYLIMMNYLGKDWTDMYDYLCKGNGPQNITQIKEIFGKVLNAVHFLHENGIGHNDIKDENIMINIYTREIKLADFGSAFGISRTPLKSFFGTKGYASPQVLSNMPYTQISQESWALGVLLFVISFRSEPFQNSTDAISKDIYFVIAHARTTFIQKPYSFHITDDIVDTIANLMHKEERLRKSVNYVRNSVTFRPYCLS